MGNSMVYPLFRSPDRSEAYGVARRLLDVAGLHRATVDAGATLTTVPEVLRWRETLPARGWFEVTADGGSGWLSASELPADHGLSREYEHAFVQLAVNSRDIFRDDPAADHTVFVHVSNRGRRGDERAAWLAAQIGERVPGPRETGWPPVRSRG